MTDSAATLAARAHLAELEAADKLAAQKRRDAERAAASEKLHNTVTAHREAEFAGTAGENNAYVGVSSLLNSGVEISLNEYTEFKGSANLDYAAAVKLADAINSAIGRKI